MFGKKCPNCAKKVEKDFVFCPYCAFPVKKNAEKDNFGLIGKDDNLGNVPLIGSGNLGLPIPLDKLIGSLMNQLGKELGNANNSQGLPRGNFKIQISTGMPMNPELMKRQQKKQRAKIEKAPKIEIPVKEIERRKILPREEAQSNVRRLSDRIIYEIKVPGVDKKEQVVINKLDNSYEIKAYSNNACYTKSIPIDADLIQSYLRENTLFLELKE